MKTLPHMLHTCTWIPLPVEGRGVSMRGGVRGAEGARGLRGLRGLRGEGLRKGLRPE